MTEAQLTRRELKKIRDRWPSAFIYKINDRVTAGIPDALLVNGRRGQPIWVEFKRLTTMRQSPEQLLTPLQQATIRRLRINDQIVFLVGFKPDRTQSVVRVQTTLADLAGYAPGSTLFDVLEAEWS